MTQEQKQLLLKDLCARLPHKVRFKCDGYPNGVVVTGIVGEQVFHTPYFIGGEIIIDKHTIDTVRPYLRPMSSMTQEECRELRWIIAVEPLWAMFDFFYSHHIDFRDLITKGLALEAPDGMYETK